LEEKKGFELPKCANKDQFTLLFLSPPSSAECNNRHRMSKRQKKYQINMGTRLVEINNTSLCLSRHVLNARNFAVKSANLRVFFTLFQLWTLKAQIINFALRPPLKAHFSAFTFQVWTLLF